jgi:hypothetical protein
VRSEDAATVRLAAAAANWLRIAQVDEDRQCRNVICDAAIDIASNSAFPEPPASVLQRTESRRDSA